MATIGSLFVSVGITGLEGAEKSIKSFSKNSALALGGLATGATAMAAVVGKAAFDLSKDIDKSQRDLQVSLGVSEATAEQYADVIKNVWGDNFGENIDDVTDSLIQVNKQLGIIDDLDAMESAVTNTHRLIDAFEELEKDKTLNSVNVLMEEFGLTAEQSFDFITTGMQEGLNASDDFLDSIGEYGNQFSTAGFDAEQFFGILDSGLAGGLLGTDKIGDAIKEMNILWAEGDKRIMDAVDSLFGVDGAYDALIKQGATAADVLPKIIEELNKIEDINERAMMERSIFGTMAEDLGPGFTSELQLVTTELEKMAGATEALDTQYNSIGQVMEGVWRKTILAITPITDAFLELANDAIPYVTEAFEKAQPILDAFATDFVDTMSAALPVIGDALYRIGDALGIGEENATGMDMALALLDGTLNLIVTAVEAVAVAFHLVANAIETASQMADIFAIKQEQLGEWLNDTSASMGAGLNDPFGLMGFASGGTVPGALGQPQLVVAHGGEHISPVGQASAGSNIYIDGINVGSGSDTQGALQEAFNILSQKIAQAEA